MSYTIVPQFTSAKSDGADATKIQPSNWNASRVINGGVTGDLLCYDSTQTSHVNGVAAVAAGQVLISAGPGVLPAWSAAPALTSATFTSFVSIGATPSTTGALRLTNAQYLYWRNALNNADILGWGIDNSNVMYTAASVSPNANASQDLGDASHTWANIYGFATLRMGATPSSTGVIRLSNNTGVYWKNAGGTLNINGLFIDSSDIVYLGDGSAANIVINTLNTIGIGGITSSFPALKRSAAGLNIRLGDDSAYAALNASVITGQTGTGTVAAGYINWATRSVMRSAADGQITLLDSTELTFGRLNFGPADASHAAIKNQGARIDSYLADGSVLAGFGASYFQTGTSPATSGSVRLSNTGSLRSMNAAASSSIEIVAVDASDNVTFGVNGGQYPTAYIFRLGGSDTFTQNGGASLDWVSSSTNPIFKFGGTSASFPALRRVSTALAIRLADNSADAPLTAAAATFSGAFNVTSVGSHAVGGGTNTAYQWLQRGSFTGSTDALGFGLISSLSPAAGSTGYGMYLAPTFVEAGSGTHPALYGLYVDIATVTGGAAAVTNTASLYVAGPMTATVTGVNYVFEIATGTTVRWAGYGAGAATFDGSGNITSVSDARHKEQIRDYPYTLESLRKLRPVLYRWNEQSKMDRDHDYAGFIAQNVQEALGDTAVGRDENGFMSLQDRAVLAACVKSIQELADKYDQLRSNQ